MKSITVIFRRPPHGNASSREGLDFALASASLGQQVTVIFIDDGVLNLMIGQTPELIGCRDFVSTFKMLPLYEINKVYACKTSLKAYNLQESDCILPVLVKEKQEISAHLRNADEVFVY